MNTLVTATPHWSTAALGHAADTSLTEFAALGTHLRMCKKLNGGLRALQPAAKTLRGFVTAHFVTTLGLLTLLIDVFSIWS